MRDIVNKTFAQMVRDKKRHKRFVALICALSILVATGVFNKLMQPVITMTSEPICGITAHSHSSACYKQQLACGLDAGDEHQHSDACYQSVLACDMAEHTHSSSCYPTEAVEETVSPINNEEKTTSVENETQSDAVAEPNITEAPAEETAPTEKETPVGTEAPTDTPAPENTEEPTAKPTAKPTAESAVEETEPSVPVLSGLAASVESVRVGQTVSWSFAVSDASELTYTITDADGNQIVKNNIETDSGRILWLADREGRFTLKLVAANQAGSVSASASVTVLPAEKLTVGVSSSSRSVFAGNNVAFTFVCGGGSAPVNVNITIKQAGTELYASDTFTDSVKVTTKNMGKKVTKITATITATDALGVTATDSLTILCAVHDAETVSKWRRSAYTTLGDDWCENLIAVAKTQLGYQESKLDFTVDSEGVKHGYTRYGHWYGARYSEWCAMFASFCLNYAGIPVSYFPQTANCANWVSCLKYLDMYQPVKSYKAADDDPDQATEGYNPVVGDLIFFDWENDGWADHVGIVIAVDGTAITTIEGNTGNAVRECYYDLTADTDILGFGCLSVAYEKYLADHAEDDLAVEADPAVEVAPAFVGDPVVEDELLEVYQASLMLDAPVYAEADPDSEIIIYLTMGTVVDVLSEEQNPVGSFCEISVDDVAGYISAEYFESDIEIIAAR